MSALLLDPMNTAAQWSALEADATTPSTELTIADDALLAAYGVDGVSGRISATADAGGHMLRRTIAAVDVSAFTELRISMRASRATSGDDQPFFIQLRLGSVARPLSDPGNVWHRLLPVHAPNHWETIKLGIDDLDAAIAGSLSQLELRCLDIGTPFTARVDDVTAVLPQMLADADRALETRLAGISVAGAPAPAVVRTVSEPVPAAAALDVTHFDLSHSPVRVRDAHESRDHTSGGGVRYVPVGVPYEITYSVAPVAATRAEQSALLEQLVRRLAPFDELVADGDRLPVELVTLRAEERVGGVPTVEPVLFYRIGARSWHSAPEILRTVSEITVETDRLEPA